MKTPAFHIQPSLLLIALAFAICSGPLFAEDELMTPPLDVAQVVTDEFEGPARVRVHIDRWLEYRGVSAGPREPQTAILRENEVGQPRLDVVVYPEVFDRLEQLGIQNPREHFVGKDVLVSGTIHRNQAPNGVSIILWVRELDQIESIAEPTAD